MICGSSTKVFLFLFAVVGVTALCSCSRHGSDVSVTLSDEEIAQLKEEWWNEKKGTEIAFEGIFETRVLSDEQKAMYAESGKTPYQFSASLEEYKEVGVDILKKDLKGVVRYTVLDSDGRVVLGKALSLSKLCPS